MLESSESLIPALGTGDRALRAATLGFDTESLNELDRLLSTLGIESACRVEAPIRKIQAGTYYGTGKLQEWRQAAEEVGDIDLFVLDLDLSPKQLQNVEKLTGKQVLDRTGVILEIFSRHAKTRESKVQVEIARLKYVLPRLAHLWSHFERQRGGGVGNKGMGETQIEVDRRLVKKRIQILEGRLKDIEKERNVQRTSREHLLKVSIVGYTNAGKSTLLNAMTQSRVLAEDKLFATLDATVRALDPDSHPPVVAIDTVGFIQNIPTNLIASFKSTLEEITESDLIVHVVDASSQHAAEQIQTTVDVLSQLGCQDKDRIMVLNKIDLVTDRSQLNHIRTVSPGAFRVSALDPVAVAELQKKILDHFRNQMQTLEVLIPYEEGKVQAQIQEFGTVLNTQYLEKGVFYKVKIQKASADRIHLSRFLTTPQVSEAI